MEDKIFLSSSFIKNKIIKELENRGISVFIKNKKVIFNKNGKIIKRGYTLLDLDVDKLESEDLHYQEYIDYVVKYVVINFEEIE